MPLYEASLSYLAVFGLTLARVGGLVTFAPFFGSGAVPLMLRTFLSLIIAWVLGPVAESSYGTVPTDPISYTLLLGSELLVGFLIGFVAKIVFAVLEVAGQLMGFQIGFGFIQVVDPQTQVETPFLATFLNLIGIVVFLVMNGHHWLLQAAAESYRVGGRGLVVSGSLIQELLRSTADMFVIGLKLAAPFMVTLFIIDVLFSILGKTAPQIHILIIGLSAKALVGFVLLVTLTYSFVPFLGREIGRVGPQLELYLRFLRG
jgi:flagellar biosynthetic protein FliR